MRSVYGLVGISGTGKSYSAERVMKLLQATLVIDDGLLIKKHKIIAGTSAKLEKNFLSATKRALFIDKQQREDVQSQLLMNPHEKLLILGTSCRMITIICTHLMIESPVIWLDIKDYTSENDRQLAMLYRQRGFHAIPIFEEQFHYASKAKFSQWLRKQLTRSHFLNTIRKDFHFTSSPLQTITIISPLFGRGILIIHPRAVNDFIKHVISEHHYPFVLKNILYDITSPQSLVVHLSIRLTPHLDSYINQFLYNIHEDGWNHLGIPYQDITIFIDSIY
ncbi:MAG: hypothetical protein OWR52_09910 [Acidibacillus sp.]|nr:hypothetical protein [Acidibacillus sp.]